MTTGPDDFPAHVKSSLMGASVTVPIKDGKLVSFCFVSTVLMSMGELTGVRRWERGRACGFWSSGRQSIQGMWWLQFRGKRHDGVCEHGAEMDEVKSWVSCFLKLPSYCYHGVIL